MDRKYQNEWHRLRAVILATGGLLRLRVNEQLEAFDLTQQQFNALRIVRGAEPTLLTTKEIKERLLDRSSDVSRLTSRLIAKGLLTKVPCRDDKREIEIGLSPQGRELLATIDQQMSSLDALLQGVSSEEAVHLAELLEKVLKKIEDV